VENVKRKALFLPIHVPAVSYAENSDAFPGIINFVNDAIIADPNAPVISRSCKLVAPGWTWILGK
jgi:hypothetical protein